MCRLEKISRSKGGQLQLFFAKSLIRLARESPIYAVPTYNYYTIFLFYFLRRHIEVHGRPTPAVFRKKPHQAGKNSYRLVWTVDSYTPIQEYRLLYRQIKPFHPVSFNCSTGFPWHFCCFFDKNIRSKKGFFVGEQVKLARYMGSFEIVLSLDKSRKLMSRY